MNNRDSATLSHWRGILWTVLTCCLLGGTVSVQSAPREFPVNHPGVLDELPAVGRLRVELERLPDVARQRALGWLRGFHFTEQDLTALHADARGGICYACDFRLVSGADFTAPASMPPEVGAAAVPVDPFPAHLSFHSRPGAPNVLFLNFSGETVSGTQWNTEVGRSEIPALAFSTDTDRATFSDAEQVAIKRIWLRVAEDYAAFNMDVTTERPATFGDRTAHALITLNKDANGDANPFSTSGGVAYVNVFGSRSFDAFRPAWIYHNNLGNNESYIAEAASHEIGHNMGLSHDGKTDGTEYYGGHGSGDISWGPLMGTGYHRNVSQWSKGEYHLANNTQDDLATIAGKVSYLADDHGNTPGTATAMTLTAGTNIVSTTPETDVGNTNTFNKGVLERTSDVDVFSFVTGTGPVHLSVTPWIMPAGTRGGNLDLALELYDESGVRLMTNNPASQTSAVIDADLSEGRYYLYLRTSGAGDPFSTSPTGYTPYGSIGQYFITGFLTEAINFIVPPVAELQVTDLTESGQSTQLFAVTYSDDVAVDVSTMDAGDVEVTGPGGYRQGVQFVSVNNPGDGTPRTATYAIAPPAGPVWAPEHNGTYTVWMRTNQVADTEGAWARDGPLGTFAVAVPIAIYAATMDANPGWTLEPSWQYGTPSYSSGGPVGGFTGSEIIAHNLSGNYANRLATTYVTTPPIDCSGSSFVTLRFQRWLRTKAKDTASIEVSTNQTTWDTVWSTSSAVTDTGWQSVQYPLPPGVAGSPSVQIRWALSSNPSQNDIGWNLDDMQLLGDGVLDSVAPVPALSVADITVGGSPSHSCSVTYTDNTGVRLASLDSLDLSVTGPHGFSNLVDYVGADVSTDGSPITGSYSIPAPGGAWAADDNGTYTVSLLGGAVEDTLNNATPLATLGTFAVTIQAVPPPVTFSLDVTVNNAAWGDVDPSNGTYVAGTEVELLATPATYYQFQQWGGDASGSDNPLTVTVSTNHTFVATFDEVYTTAYPTPHWWLASYGYTNDFESATTNLGANQVALWESYIAGLDPTDPDSRLTLQVHYNKTNNTAVMEWNPVATRLYTLMFGTNLTTGLAPLPAAIDLSWETNRFTNHVDMGSSPSFYQLKVRRP